MALSSSEGGAVAIMTIRLESVQKKKEGEKVGEGGYNMETSRERSRREERGEKREREVVTEGRIQRPRPARKEERKGLAVVMPLALWLSDRGLVCADA